MIETELIISEELRGVIPPLTEAEKAALEESILSEGIRDALCIWQGMIVDGHHRYKIAQKYGIEYNIREFNFESLEHAKLWMIDNAKARRNLSDFALFELEDKRADILREKGKDKQGHGQTSPGKTLLSIVDKSVLPDEPHNTQKIIADRLDWSTGKTAMAQKIKRDADEQIKEKLRSKKLSINEAYKGIQKAERKNKHIQQREMLAKKGQDKKVNIDFRLGDFANVFYNIPDNSIDCIITDPPYPYKFINEWTKLSKFANRVLKPNGFCIAYSGQMHLPEVMQRMNVHLRYYWTFAVYHEGLTQIVNGVNLICRWKPILVYQNGKKKIENTIQDYFVSKQREKYGHAWQQSESGVSYLIEMFTNPGEIILDPFAGSGTTLISAIKKGRIAMGAEIDKNSYDIAKQLIWQQEKK